MKVLEKYVYRTVKGKTKHCGQIKCLDCGSRIFPRSVPSILGPALTRPCFTCNRLQVHLKRGTLESVLPVLRRKQKMRNECQAEGNTLDHLQTGTLAYQSWKAMMQRCYNDQAPNYSDYGARGIEIDPQWFDFGVFFQYMGERPKGFEIDRINNNLGYQPGNCRWVQAEENNANRREFFKKGTDRKNIGWWTAFGLYNNPYIYGPMPWKRTSKTWRRVEALERGWFVSKKKEPEYLE